MAARKRPLTEPKLAEMRARIQATLLLKKMQDHALGECEMSATQSRAAEVLLKKTMPDLSAVELRGDPDKPVNHSLNVSFK